MSGNLFVDRLPALLLQTAEAAPDGGGMLMQMAPLLIIVGIFYFLIIRPQMKQQREHQAMLEAIKAGDRVVTSGGLHGTVKAVGKTTVKLEVAPSVVLTCNKAQIGGKVAESDDGDTK